MWEATEPERKKTQVGARGLEVRLQPVSHVVLVVPVNLMALNLATVWIDGGALKIYTQVRGLTTDQLQENLQRRDIGIDILQKLPRGFQMGTRVKILILIFTFLLQFYDLSDCDL